MDATEVWIVLAGLGAIGALIGAVLGVQAWMAGKADRALEHAGRRFGGRLLPGKRGKRGRLETFLEIVRRLRAVAAGRGTPPPRSPRRGSARCAANRSATGRASARAARRRTTGSAGTTFADARCSVARRAIRSPHGPRGKPDARRA